MKGHSVGACGFLRFFLSRLNVLGAGFVLFLSSSRSGCGPRGGRSGDSVSPPGRKRECGKPCSPLRKAREYSAASTRVLSAKYFFAFRSVFVRLARPCRLLLPFRSGAACPAFSLVLLPAVSRCAAFPAFLGRKSRYCPIICCLSTILLGMDLLNLHQTNHESVSQNIN